MSLISPPIRSLGARYERAMRDARYRAAAQLLRRWIALRMGRESLVPVRAGGPRLPMAHPRIVS